MIDSLFQGKVIKEISLGFEANSDAMNFVMANDCFDLLFKYKFESGNSLLVKSFLFGNIYRYIFSRETYRIQIPFYGRGSIRQVEISTELLNQFFNYTPINGNKIYVYIVDVLGAGVAAIFSGDEVVEVSPETYSSINFFD